MKTKILAYFQICISVPLNPNKDKIQTKETQIACTFYAVRNIVKKASKSPPPPSQCWIDLIAQLIFHFSSNLNIELGGSGKIQLVGTYFGQDCRLI